MYELIKTDFNQSILNKRFYNFISKKTDWEKMDTKLSIIYKNY